MVNDTCIKTVKAIVERFLDSHLKFCSNLRVGRQIFLSISVKNAVILIETDLNWGKKKKFEYLMEGEKICSRGDENLKNLFYFGLIETSEYIC